MSNSKNYAEMPAESPEVMPFTPPELRQRTWDELFTDVNLLIHSTNSLTAEVEKLRGQLDNANAIINRDTGEIADYARTVERLNKKVVELENPADVERSPFFCDGCEKIAVKESEIVKKTGEILGLQMTNRQLEKDNEQLNHNVAQADIEISRLNKGETWQRRIAELEIEKQGLYVRLDLTIQQCKKLEQEKWQLNKDLQSFQDELESLKFPDKKPFETLTDKYQDEPECTIRECVPDEPCRDMSIADWSTTVGELSNQVNHQQDLAELSERYMNIIERLLQLQQMYSRK